MRKLFYSNFISLLFSYTFNKTFKACNIIYQSSEILTGATEREDALHKIIILILERVCSRTIQQLKFVKSISIIIIIFLTLLTGVSGCELGFILLE